MLQISKRGENAPSSPVRKLVPYADAAKAKGIKVYHVNIGDPDFEAPEIMISSLQKIAADLKRIPYTNSKGAIETVKAWQKYYHDVGIELNENEILVTTGGSEALLMSAAVVADPDDEFIVFEPFYGNYNSFGNFISAKIVPVALDAANGYHLPSNEEIIRHITPKTKAIIFTNPNNPTGTVFSDDEVSRIVTLAHERNLFLIADETYRGMCFDGKVMKSVLDVATPEEAQHIIITDSVSKRLNACGARIGAIISKNANVMDAVFRVAQGRLSAPYIEQAMVVDALSDSMDYLHWLTSQYESRRNIFLDTLEKELGTSIHRPEGAFYTMVQLPVEDTDDFAQWLLTDFSDNNETIMVATGAGFYATPGKGKNEIRVAYVLNETDLKRAAQLLALGVKKYLEKK